MNALTPWSKWMVAALVGAVGLMSTAASAGPTLERIKSRGLIKVGVGTTPGFFAPDDSGRWQGNHVALFRYRP